MGYKKQVFRSLAMVSQLGLSVMTPIFLCIFAGYCVDTHFGTKTMIFFLIIGVLAGGRCGYQMAKMTVLAGEKDEKKEKLQEWEKRQRERAKEPDMAVCSKPKRPSRVRAASEQAGRQEEKRGASERKDGKA
ncbi:MAG: AtpZ/AtpI family protein [Lachnospiraceae bacterium]|nr:AtpZ/AtpI family protein [Lachnospiraceae bacterium]